MTSPNTDPRRLLVQQTRDVRTYAELWHGSGVILALAHQYGRGQHWLYLSSILMTAFTFEAYLNHVGPRVDPEWCGKERLSYREKWNALTTLLNVQLPGGWGGDPMQTVGTLFRFRDNIAHGRSEQLAPKKRVVAWDGDVEDFFNSRPKTEWERHLVDDTFAQRVRTQVKAALEAVHARRTDDKEALLTMGMALGSASLWPPRE